MATLGSVTANGITRNFQSFSEAGPRYFIDLIPSGAQYDIKRFRAPGWTGNALIRGGYVSQQLILIVRYQDTLTNANAAWKADRDLWAQYNAVVNKTVVGEDPWSRCTLRTSERITDEAASGLGNTKWFNVRYLFDVEEQY